MKLIILLNYRVIVVFFLYFNDNDYRMVGNVNFLIVFFGYRLLGFFN